MNAQIKRETFKTSRLLDFFSKKELTAQIGHKPQDWPLVVVKELVDNALDACEEANTAPVIDIEVNDQGITVMDNGPGIPAKTVHDVLDFSVRVSSREAYVAPDRGAQGNALKTVVAMPYVLDGDRGEISITAVGIRHHIVTTVDRVRQLPAISRNEVSDENVKNGTLAAVHWPNSACSILSNASTRILQIAGGFVHLNPHLTLTLRLFGESHRWDAITPRWSKWHPSNPTVPHWYSAEDLWRLIAAHLAEEDDNGTAKTVREFVSTFAGLAGSAKQRAVLESTGMARASLADLAKANSPDMAAVATLLEAMKQHSRPVKPAALGVIGKDAIEARFKALGCKMETFKYRKCLGEMNGRPQVAEMAFAWCPKASGRVLITGVNWSPGILNPFRELGEYGQSLDSILEQQRVGHGEPTVLLLHLACPRPTYSDRGKSSVVLADEYDDEADKEEEG